MPPQQRLIVLQNNRRIDMVLGLNEQNRTRLQIAQKHAAIDFRLHDIVINLVAKIGVGSKHADLKVCVQTSPHSIDVRIIHP